MKSIFLAIMFMGSVSMASGKLTFKPVFDEQKKMHPVAGLSIYQKLIGNTALVHWSGFGEVMPEEVSADDTVWLSSKTQVNFQLGRLTIAPGVQFKKTTEEMKWHKGVYVEFSSQLW